MPRLSTATEAPTFTSIKAFREALEQNAMSIPSNQTELGYLSLVLSTTEYIEASMGVAFEIPTDPGPTAPNPISNVTAATRRSARIAATTGTGGETASGTDPETLASIEAEYSMLPYTAAESLRLYNDKKREYIQYKEASKALKKLIINNIDEQYIHPVKQARTLYTLVTPMQLLTHIIETYGTITDKDKTNNEERMKAPWIPPTPIEALFEQLMDGRDYAVQGGEIILDSTMVSWGYNNIMQTGLFTSDCKKWSKMLPREKTWTNFCKFYKIADTIRQEHNQTTTAEATYTANQVEEILHKEMALWTAQVAQQQNQGKSNPTTDNAITTPEQDNANTGLTAANVREIIKTAISENSNNRNEGGGRRNGRNNGRKTQQLKAQALEEGIPVSYCWSHGVTQNLRHNSQTCNRKNQAHKDNATYQSRMEGTDMINTSRK